MYDQQDYNLIFETTKDEIHRLFHRVQKITPDSTFEELDLDSLDKVDLLCAIEKVYNVKELDLSDTTKDKFFKAKTLNQMCECLAEEIYEQRNQSPRDVQV